MTSFFAWVAALLAWLGAPPAPAPPEPAKEVTVAWVGDVVVGSQYGLPPDEGRRSFAAVAGPLRRADLALGNLEQTLSVGGASKCGAGRPNCFAFQAPPRYAAALTRAGFDAMNLANNHSFDYGAQGRAQTKQALRRQGIASSGAPGQVALSRVEGLTVALVGFASYPWSAPLNDLTAVRHLVQRAARRADIVVVAFHGGAEGADQGHVPFAHEYYLGEDRGDLRRFAHTAVAAGGDLVVGSGPHVLRGLEVYRGRLIAYSLGNFAGYHNFSTAGVLGLSGLLRARLAADGRFLDGRLLSTRLRGPGLPVFDPAQASAHLVQRLSADDFGRRAPRIDRDGRIRPPGH